MSESLLFRSEKEAFFEKLFWVQLARFARLTSLPKSKRADPMESDQPNLILLNQQTPCASIASTTFSKPAIFAPTT
jgi:hypothetical protein